VLIKESLTGSAKRPNIGEDHDRFSPEHNPRTAPAAMWTGSHSCTRACWPALYRDVGAIIAPPCRGEHHGERMTVRRSLIVGAMIAALFTGSAGLANAAGRVPAGHEWIGSVPTSDDWIGSVPDGHHEGSSMPDGHYDGDSVPAGQHDN
jgi:hypothetical protein